MSDDAQSIGPINLIFLTTDCNNFKYSENYNVRRAADFFMFSGLLESVTIIDFQGTEAFPSFNLTKTKCIIHKLFMVKKENVTVSNNLSNFSTYENNNMMKNLVSMYTQNFQHNHLAIYTYFQADRRI
jgi:hypothetical protein